MFVLLVQNSGKIYIGLVKYSTFVAYCWYLYSAGGGVSTITYLSSLLSPHTWVLLGICVNNDVGRVHEIKRTYPASRTHGLFITIFYLHDIYTISTIYGGACPNPFDNPLLLGIPYPYSLNSPLTYLDPSSVLWCDPCPLWSLVGCILTPPPFLPIPQRFPFSKACPPTTTLRYQLHIVRYTKVIYDLKVRAKCDLWQWNNLK
jgi:hypothetical protein